MSVEINAISKRYGEQTVLNNVTFSANRGEVVGFLGPNGAGKSTLMKIITGYISPNSGRVSVNGIDVADNPREVKRLLGYLPEHNPLYLDMYVKEYLRFSGRSYGIGKGLNRRIEEVVELTGITPERHKKLGQLSKGYRQRVGLAQAMLHNPDVLILDEPTTGLDPNQLVDIRNLIVKIGEEKTVILSTHIMQEVEAMCSRVVIISKGELVANEPTAVARGLLMGEKQQVLVEFVEEVGKSKLAGISGINAVEQVDSRFFLVESNISEDIRPLIFNFAVSNGYTIISLQQKERKLEDVFRQLTSSVKEYTN